MQVNNHKHLVDNLTSLFNQFQDKSGRLMNDDAFRKAVKETVISSQVPDQAGETCHRRLR